MRTQRLRLASGLGILAVAAAGCATVEKARPGLPVPQHVFAPAHPELSAPDESPASDEAYTVSAPASLFDERGTLAMWFRLDDPIRGEHPTITLLDGDAIRVEITGYSHSVRFLVIHGPAMTGPPVDGNERAYIYAQDFTHLEGGRWYSMALTWDTSDYQRIAFHLDGVRQGTQFPFLRPGQLKAADRDVSIRVGGDGVTCSGPAVYAEALSEAELTAVFNGLGRYRYIDEGLNCPGGTFAPADVDFAHPVYATQFDDPAEIEHWRLEGGFRKRIEGGRLVLENGPPPGEAGPEAKHLVCWLNRETPADFLLEFTYRPEDRRRGLAIAFVNARGRGGEGIFDSSLAPRDGTFSQYTNGDVDSYHVSYWAGGRGTANLRKNAGFYLAAIGEDYVTRGPADAFQTVRIYKHGGRVRLTVDDLLALAFDDDGRTYGPVHAHSGWIGLRQMAHTRSAEYGHLKVFPLK